MVIVFNIELVVGGGDTQVRKSMRKRFTYTLDKPIGNSFKDGAWEGFNEAITFNVQLKNGVIEVCFAEVVVATQGLFEVEEKRFRSHGWKPADECANDETFAWGNT